nr:purple acid phosphatase 3-like [Ipomoea batatas]
MGVVSIDLLVRISLGLWLAAAVAMAELPRLEHSPAKSGGSLSVMVVGDWGRKGTYNQSQLAVQMGKIGEEKDIDFAISTGDNFYDNGLSGIDDTAFDESFTHIYTAPSLQKQWYSEKKTTDGYASDPSFSIQANHVDLYINGHDHCLEHISSLDSALQFVTSGGGSKAWRGDISDMDPEEMKFYYDGQGFMTLQISPGEIDFQMYDIFGHVLHRCFGNHDYRGELLASVKSHSQRKDNR